MTSLPTNLRCYTASKHHKHKSIPLFTPATKLHFCNPALAITPQHSVYLISDYPSTKSVRNVLVSNAVKQNPSGYYEETCGKFHILRKWIEFVQEVVPGGCWWNLSRFEGEINSSFVVARPMTALRALSQLWSLVAEEKWILCTAFSALTIAALSEISMPAIITTCIFSAQSGKIAVFYRNSQLLFLLCVISGICSGFRSGSFAILNMILDLFAANISVKRLRGTVFSSLLLQDISFFDKETVGELTSRIGADCQRLSYTIGKDIHLILRNTLQGTGAFINLMSLSWPLALSSLVICFILSVVFLFYSQYQKKAALLSQDFAASANEAARETFSSVRTIRAYGTEREEFQRFVKWLNRLAFVGSRESVANGFWNLSFMVLYRMTQVFAVLLGGKSISTGCVTAEQLTKYILYCEWLIYAAWRIQDNMSSLLQSFGACEKVFQLMHLNPSCQFLPKGIELKRLMGCIEFVNVSFHYSSRNTVSILKNVNFSIAANEVIAIVGFSGSGKSTLINLLLRLYEPTSGEIFIDGTPPKEMDIRWLREKIGFVEQEPHIFHMDVGSNISYGCPRSITHEEVESAAKIANAHEFISALPSGYDTIIDDNLLSGGQKQRIAIARAILRDPTILILDEATSALDAMSESYIKEVLLSLKKDSKTRTLIIIAHRLSTLKVADRILVMNDGQIVEIGNHCELLQRNGHYARLFKLQTDASSVIMHQKEGIC